MSAEFEIAALRRPRAAFAAGVLLICMALSTTRVQAQDCNGNGIPDACDIECGIPTSGSCDMPGCGTASDCNDNGVPDGCEMQGAGFSIDFDGIDDYVRVPRSTSLEPTTALTVECWIRPDGQGSFHSRIIEKVGDFQPGYIIAGSQGNDHLLQFRIDGAQLGAAYAISNVNINTYIGQWVHLAGVYSVANNYCKIYINGVERASVAAKGTLNHTDDLFFANAADQTGDYDGKMDEVRIWNVARTQAQIVEAMGHRLLGSETGLVGYWRFDEGTGQAVQDSSPFHNHGTLGNSSSSEGIDPVWSSLHAPILMNDCNENGILDSCELAEHDCNANGTIDECEAQANCNGNDEQDICESGGSNDCDGDGVTDWCETQAGADDCDGDLFPDSCESAAGNSAMQFDGSNDLVVLPDDIIRNRTTITVEMWFKSTANGVLLGYQNTAYPTGPSNYMPAIYIGTDGKLRAQFFNSIATPITSAAAVNNGQWHHLALVGAVNAQQLYLDGTVVNATPYAGTINHSNMSKNMLGNGVAGNVWPASPNTYYPFNGTMDEVRVWGVARTATEIQSNMHRSFTNPAPGLVGYWKLDTGSGQSAVDSSGIGNHGILGTNSTVEAYDPTWSPNNLGTPGPSDCNGNFVPDACEIASGASTDCNANGVLDVCEITATADCNSNGILDTCELLGHDCNANGMLDSCEVAQSLDFTSQGTIIAKLFSLTPPTPQGGGSQNPEIIRDGVYPPTNNSNNQLQFDTNHGGAQGTEDWIGYQYSQTKTFGALLFQEGGQYGDGGWFDSLVVQVRQSGQWNNVQGVNFSPTYAANNGVAYEQYSIAFNPIDGDAIRLYGDPGGSGKFISVSELRVFFDADCNSNGIPDSCDISVGASGDCNLNGIPDDCEAGTASVTHRFKACIDGTSHLILKGGTAQWHQLGGGAAAPGRSPTCSSLPQTIIDGVTWDPVWPEAYPAQIRYDAYSSIYSNLMPVYPSSLSGITIIPITMREPVTVFQSPSAANNWTAIIQIPDASSGVFTYEFDVTMRFSVPVDCNGNSVLDTCDIDGENSADCNGNLIPDDCEPQNDCNANQILDICESLSDCDNDGISDACEISNCVGNDPACSDCNSSGIPDVCEIPIGSSSILLNGDYVVVPNSASLSISSSLTLEVWAKAVNPAGSSQMILFKGDGQSGLDPYYIRLSSNVLEFAIDDDANAHAPITGSVAAFNWAQFHHIAAVFDDAANQLRLYVDGQLIASGTTSIHPMSSQGNMNFWMGSATTQQYFNGTLDEVRVWNIARTQQELLNWKDRQLKGNESGLVGYWRLDDGTGQIAKDASALHNHGVLGSSSAVDSADPAWVTPGVSLALLDCDNNGRLDECELATGAADCNDNDILDTCEAEADCNHNSVQDICEEFGANDCDADGISDWCETQDGAADCDSDLIPNFCEAGIGNYSLQFDGSNDLVVLPDDTIRSRTTLTVEAWFKTTAGGVVLGYQNATYPTSPSNYVPVIYVGTDGKLRAQFNNNVSAPITTANTVNNGVWHHVALVGAVNAQQMYLDGVLVNSTPLAGTINHLAMTKNQIGAGRAGNTWPASPSGYYIFNGQIDEVRIWNVARSGVEIAANRNKSFSGSVPGLVGYWKLNSGSGQSAVDSAGFNQHGVLGTTAGSDTSDPTWVAYNSGTPSPADCNGNTIPDTCDLGAGTSVDCNANAIPDECEADCNNNGIADSCDLTAGTALDCNNNGVPDSCDVGLGTSADANANLVPDECEPDIRIVPVVTLVEPFATTEIRSAEPSSATAVTRGGYYYVEIWASDVGSLNTGLSGAYVDVNFCTQSVAQEVQHGTLYTVFPSGTIQAGMVDEFGGSALPGGSGVAPQWVRIGWIKMLASNEVFPCNISLTPGAGGVAALGRGLIPNSLVNRGSASIEIAPPLKSYDLDNSTVINVGDLSLFANSWQESVPPGDEEHDFDCTGFVGVSDLSWFATGWLKNVNDPTILYPPCEDEGGGHGVIEDIDVRFRVTVRSLASGADTVVNLPASLTSITAGQQFHAEVWASDVGDVNTGLTSAYVDLTYPPDASVVSMNHHGVFNVFGSGTDSGGVVDELGGSTLSQDTATEPLWTRVASVRMLASESRPVFVFGLTPSSTGVASYGRGEVQWESIDLVPASIGTPTVGDIDADGDIDQVDLTLFSNVLLGAETNAGRISRSDMNGDTHSDGADVQGFVEAMIE